MKTGLVLEGGAMRGMYTAGVLDVMLENGIDVDGAVGVSAGAVFGCNYKSRQIGRVIRYNTAYCRDPRYMSFRSLVKTGDLYGEKFCYHEIPDTLDPFDVETYVKNPVKFYVVCTDVTTGKAVYHLCEAGTGEDIQWMRASASMPLVSNIVSVGGYELLDGGVADSIPIEWFRKMGYEKNIVVLTRHEGYRKKPDRMLPVERMVFGKKYPELVKAMANRYLVYNRALDLLRDMEERGEVLIIRPSSRIEISRTERDPEKLRGVYAMGRADAGKLTERMKKFLSADAPDAAAVK